MKKVKLGAGVLNQTPLDWENNLRNIVDCIERARRESVSILCLPELCITDYGCEDAFHAAAVLERAEELLLQIAAESTGIAVSVGLPLMLDGSIYNVAGLLVDGQVAGFVPKQHLAGDGIHYEPRWFKPWPQDVRTEIRLGSQRYPIGDLLFDLGGVRIGFEICEDAWVGIRPGARLSALGADIILNPSASHFAFGKHEIRRRFVLEGSRAFQVSYVYANLVGNTSGRAIYDGDAMIASHGAILASGRRFSFADMLLTTATVDIDLTRMERSRIYSYVPHPSAGQLSRVEIDWQVEQHNVDVAQHPDTTSATQMQGLATSSDELKFEEFTRAVSLGLFDYLRKSRSNGVVISLSGGADSAAVAVLSRLTLELATGELGLTSVNRKLNLRDAERVSTVDELAKILITTVYQATRNSGEVTRHAAATVAEAISATHLELDVERLASGYVQLIEAALERELGWETDDLALQNIQARTRSPSVWLLANLKNALLLSTSNRSEAAVGYATMDGDTSGGLSPIAGIDKAFLRKWLTWMASSGPVGVGPIAALSVINCQQPTAELRPAEAAQTDEADLMPYEVLDQIERWAIRDKRFPQEVFDLLHQSYPDETNQTKKLWVTRFFRLWSRNQWKRERYAPSFHLDDENLDPKTWCRFPILSSGFHEELKRLEEEPFSGEDNST